MMSRLKRLVTLLLLLLVGAAVLLLILQNPQRSQFQFLYWFTPELPFSLLLILAFVLGAVCASLLSLWLSGRRRLRAFAAPKG